MPGHIQMTSIEMKEYLKRLSVEDIDEWEQRNVIKSAYTAIYETSKKLVDTTGNIINKLGYVTSPINELGIRRLQACC